MIRTRGIAECLARAALAASALLLASCGPDCPRCPQVDLASGTFATSTPGSVGFGTPADAFPWGGEAKVLTLDVANRTVQLRYTRNGREVVETWRIRDLSQCPP